MSWKDDFLTRERYLHADDAVFDEVADWQRHFFNDYAREGAAYLSISATDPENLKGVDPARLVRAQRASGKALTDFNRLQMCGGFPWCIASIPVPSWARRVFPDCSEEEAMQHLWNAIFTTMRITGDGQSAARWHEHMARLHRRIDRLNKLNFVSLHYQNALGTDLTVRLPEGHVWEGGDDRLPPASRSSPTCRPRRSSPRPCATASTASSTPPCPSSTAATSSTASTSS